MTLISICSETLFFYHEEHKAHQGKRLTSISKLRGESWVCRRTLNSFFRHPTGHAMLLSLLLMVPWPSAALESDKDQPILVEADGADINDRTGISVYTGNVIVTQGSIKINADKITITQQDDKSDHILAEGRPVRFQQEPDDKKELIKGRALRTEYDMDSEMLYMTGDAVLSQGKDSFRSDRITYDRVKAQVKAGSSAKGKQRVRISIQPRNKEEKSK